MKHGKVEHEWMNSWIPSLRWVWLCWSALSKAICILFPSHLLFVSIWIHQSDSFDGSNALHVNWPHWAGAVRRPLQPRGEDGWALSKPKKGNYVTYAGGPIFRFPWTIWQKFSCHKEFEMKKSLLSNCRLSLCLSISINVKVKFYSSKWRLMSL